MRGYVFIVLFAWLLAGCQGGMKAMSADQGELISLAYQDGMDTRVVHGSSTSGESFSGSLLWTKDERKSGNYCGVLVGETEGHFRSHSNAMRLNENVQAQQETAMGWPLLFSSSLSLRRNRRLF